MSQCLIVRICSHCSGQTIYTYKSFFINQNKYNRAMGWHIIVWQLHGENIKISWDLSSLLEPHGAVSVRDILVKNPFHIISYSITCKFRRLTRTGIGLASFPPAIHFAKWLGMRKGSYKGQSNISHQPHHHHKACLIAEATWESWQV